MTESWLEEIASDECVALLRANAIGRIGVILDGLPLVLPVNYRLIESDESLMLGIRTRPGHVIDRSGSDVAFEIDGIDDSHRRGWSVLVRGTLRRRDSELAPISSSETSDSWLSGEGDVWLVIEASDVSGRRLCSSELEWAFLAQAYL